MANDIVSGLFGLTPQQVQQQQQEQINSQAAAFAKQDPFERASMMGYQAGAGLGGIGAGMMGMVNPEVEAARNQQEVAGKIAGMTVDQLRQYALTIPDPRMKMGIMAYADQKEAQQSTLSHQAAQTFQAEAAAAKSLREPTGSDTMQQFAEWKKTNPNGNIVDFRKAVDKPANEPTSIDEYKFALSQGYKGSFQDWIKTKAQSIHVNAGIDSGESAITPETVDFYANQQLLTGDQSWRTGLGRSKHGVALILAVDKRIPALAKEVNMTPADAASNKQEFIARQKALKDFTTGQQGQMVNSFNTAIDHLDTLKELGNALGNNNIQLANLTANKVSAWTGGEAPTNFDSAKQIVGAEIVKAIVAKGGGQSEREDAANQISRISSPAQLAGYIENMKKLMGGQLKSLKLQYETTTKRKDFDDKLTPKSKSVIENMKDKKSTDSVSGLPAGSVSIGKSPSGQIVYQSPDGKKWVQ